MELLRTSPESEEPPPKAAAASSWLSRCTCPGMWPERLVRTRDICFRSQGSTLRGYLILPVMQLGRRPPVLILSHGFSATQHMGLLDTARALCRRTGCMAPKSGHR